MHSVTQNCSCCFLLHGFNDKILRLKEKTTPLLRSEWKKDGIRPSAPNVAVKCGKLRIYILDPNLRYSESAPPFRAIISSVEKIWSHLDRSSSFTQLNWTNHAV